MADPGTPQVNGARATAPDLLPGPSNIAKAQARIRAGRAETLAALEKGELKDEPAPVKPKAEPEAKQEAKPTEAGPEETPTTEEGESPEVEETTTEEPAKAAAATDDPEQSKRLATIQAAEKRSREKIAKEREQLKAQGAELEKMRAEVAAQQAEIDAYKKAKERARIDPVGYLKAGGINDLEGLEYAAKMAHAEFRATTDPANREAAAEMQRHREHESELQALKRDHQELKQQVAREKQQAQLEGQRAVYLDHAVNAINGETPCAKALAAKNPAKLRAALWATAEQIFDTDDEFPTVEEVITAYEATRRAELEELGIDVASLTAPKTKQNNQPADKKHPAKTLGNDLSTPRVPRPAKSDREHRAETLAMLESGKLE